MAGRRDNYRPGVRTALLAVFGLVLLAVPPHVLGIAFLVLLALYEHVRRPGRGDPGQDPYRPDFGAMFDEPGYVREQEEMR